MVNWNLGSIALSVHNRIEDVPSYYSGTEMLNAINQRLKYIEDELGISIGSNSISDDYHGVLTNFAVADTLLIKNIEGIDVSSIKLDELSISKNSNSPAIVSAKEILETAENQLINLKGKYNFEQVWGC